MILRKENKDIGVSVYGEDGKPLSIEVFTKENWPPPLRSGIDSILFAHASTEQRERIEKKEKEYYDKPKPYEVYVTLGVGLDRVTAKLTKEDFNALKLRFLQIDTDIQYRQAHISRYNKEKQEEKEKESKDKK